MSLAPEHPLPGRRMSTAVVVGVCVALAVEIMLTWYVTVPSGILDSISQATAQLVQSTLVLTAMSAALVVLVARPTLRDLGLDRGLARGLAVWLVGYVVIQVGLAIAAGALRPGPALTLPAGLVVGSVIAQLVGTAVVEESVFRGLVFRQLALRMRIVPATALSAFLFAIWHIPNRLWLGLAGLELVGDLAMVWVGGVLAVWLYLRSRNLYVVIALHALFNEGAPLVASPISHQVILAIYVLAFMIGIEWIRRRDQSQVATRSGMYA